MISNSIISKDIEAIIESDLPWNKFSNKHILITGANGFLPAYIVYSLLSANIKYKLNLQLTALVRNKEKALKRFADFHSEQALTILQQDVCEKISANEYKIIIHAASQASPKYYSTDPIGTLKPNVIGTNNLLELAVNSQVDSFLYFSSSEVYGQLSDKEIPIKENQFGYLDPAQFRSCYAESKRMGETICVSYFHQKEVPVKIVRPFHTYGPGMDLNDGRVYADFVKNIIQGNHITMTSDGSAKRAFCYIADATIGFLTVLMKGTSGEAYNIGNQSQEYSIKELAQKLVQLYPEKKLKVNTGIIDKNYIPSKVNRNCPDCSKVAQLGWRAVINIEEGFSRTLKSYE